MTLGVALGLAKAVKQSFHLHRVCNSASCPFFCLLGLFCSPESAALDAQRPPNAPQGERGRRKQMPESAGAAKASDRVNDVDHAKLQPCWSQNPASGGLIALGSSAAIPPGPGVSSAQRQPLCWCGQTDRTGLPCSYQDRQPGCRNRCKPQRNGQGRTTAAPTVVLVRFFPCMRLSGGVVQKQTAGLGLFRFKRRDSAGLGRYLQHRRRGGERCAGLTGVSLTSTSMFQSNQSLGGNGWTARRRRLPLPHTLGAWTASECRSAPGFPAPAQGCLVAASRRWSC
jgi:hypothetical protein